MTQQARPTPGTQPQDEVNESGWTPAGLGTPAAVGEVVGWLVARSHTMSPDELAALTRQAGQRLGAQDCRVWLVARDQRSLFRLPLYREEVPVGGLGLDATLAGRAFRLTTVVTSTSDGSRLWVPLLNGTERLGVLEVLISTQGTADQSVQVAELALAAVTLSGLVAELVVSKGQYTDAFEQVRRALPMGVAAEMLWRQLPPLTFAHPSFVISAQLEPWNEVGGDAFDYSLEGDVLHLAVFDAMGHGLGATLLAGVALAAYRNARRAGHGLTETANSIDTVLNEQFGDDSFVTAVLGQLQLSTGRLRLVCAAHPSPLLVRGGRAIGETTLDPGLPLGLGGRTGPSADTVIELGLQPGDRVLLFTDGVIEARSEHGEFFGTNRLLDLLNKEEAGQQPTPETLRRLIQAVLAHQQGTLQDDATLLMLEWAPPQLPDISPYDPGQNDPE